MSEFDRFWTTSKWSRQELQGKTVQFVLTGAEYRVSGTGIFEVRERPGGEILIQIEVPVVRTPNEAKDQIFTLTPANASQITKHPDPSVAEFQCLS